MASSRKTKSPDLLQLVAASYERLTAIYPASGRHICVALSGGLDSVVLLHALVRMLGTGDGSLLAAHVHHGLSPNADAWQAHCASLCAHWDVPFLPLHVAVPRDDSRGLEAAARACRHEALSALQVDWIALAHHRDDQAETVLYRLLRGTGVRGMGAMAEMEARPFGSGLWRPMLGLPRQAIQTYAAEWELNWVEDESNLDTRFARNFLRKDVLPLLKNRFPGADATLARAASLCRESDDLLEELALEDQARCRLPIDDREDVFDLTLLAALSEPRLRNLVRLLLAKAGELMPDERRLREAVRQLLEVGREHPLRLPFGVSALCAYRNRVWLEPAVLEGGVECSLSPDCASVPWGRGEVRFSRREGAGIAAHHFAEGDLTLGLRPSGEKVQMALKGPGRSFKNLLQEAGVPPWQRAVLPVLRIGGHVAWIAGVGVAEAFCCRPGEQGVLPEWILQRHQDRNWVSS